MIIHFQRNNNFLLKMNTAICKNCCDSFIHVLKHLAKSPICKETYSPEELNELKLACTELVRKRRNSKKRQNYDSEKKKKMRLLSEKKD